MQTRFRRPTLLPNGIRLYEKLTLSRTPCRRRVEPLSHSFLGWIPQLVRTPARTILDRNGLDAYVFVRFLFLMLEIFFPLYVLLAGRLYARDF